MKFSIIVPTKNSEVYLSTSLNSILIQTYKDFEILICDSKSNDKTLEIINRFASSDKRIKIVSYHDDGVPDALNKAFKYCSGEIVTWLNSDDYYCDENSLQLVIQDFKKKNKKKIDYVVGDFINISEKGKIINYFISFIPKKKIKKLYFYNQIFTGALFFKKETLNSFIFNKKFKYAFEYQFIIHLLKNYLGSHISKFITYFTIRKNQLSSNKEILRQEFEEIIRNHNLIYSNNFFLRLIAYLKQGDIIRFLKYKFLVNDKK